MRRPAQRSPPQKRKRVTITGSNIKRIDAESTAPLQVINREELTRSGLTQITDVLRQLTAAGSGGVSNFDGSNSFSVGASSVSLRGLGSQATLVLLNGRRIAPFAPADPNYGQASFVNLDSLPFEVVERVEILEGRRLCHLRLGRDRRGDQHHHPHRIHRWGGGGQGFRQHPGALP